MEKEKVMTDKQTDRQTDRIFCCRLDPFCGWGRVKIVDQSCVFFQGAIPRNWSGEEKKNGGGKRGNYLEKEKVMTDKQTDRQAEFSLVDLIPSVKGSSKNR